MAECELAAALRPYVSGMLASSGLCRVGREGCEGFSFDFSRFSSPVESHKNN
jgi:hypothetical protein